MTPTSDAQGTKPRKEDDPGHRRRMAFVVAYEHPDSPSFRKVAKSVLTVSPEGTSEETAARTGYRWLARRDVQREIERIRFNVQMVNGFTTADLVQRLLERESFFAHRGQPGDAAAAAGYMRQLKEIFFPQGSAIPRRGEPIGQPALPPGTVQSAEERQAFLGEVADRRRMLDTPNPVPQGDTPPPIIIDAGEGEPVEEAPRRWPPKPWLQPDPGDVATTFPCIDCEAEEASEYPDGWRCDDCTRKKYLSVPEAT